MAKRKKVTYRVVYYNTTNLPQGEELKGRIKSCISDCEKVLLLYELNNSMTIWETFRQFQITYGGNIQKIEIGARIKNLCAAGVLYKSVLQVREERGALNYIYKLWPEDGEFPEDFDMDSLEKIHIPFYFGTDGYPDEQRTRQEFEKKLQSKLKQYAIGN
jgi:hypothetical protein